MKKRMVLLSVLVLCGCMLIGAGAADAASQTQLTRQAITHFQQSPPEEDTSYPGYPTWKTWKIDSCEVFPCRLIEEKDIWELIFTPSDDRSRWICAVYLSAGKIITPLFNGSMWKAANDQLLLETGGRYQLCDLNGSLTDVSIPHTGHVLAVDDQGYVLCQYPVPRTVRTDSGAMNDTFYQYTRCWDRILPSCRTASTSITTLVSMITLMIANCFITISPLSVSVRPTGICRTVDRGRGCISTVNICSSTAAARSSATRAMMKYRTKTIAGLVVTVRPSICWTATEMSANRRITAMFPALGLKI